MKTFFEEFKKFAMRGNVADLAVAVVVGGAFGKIVSSLVDTIIMPTVGILLGNIDFTSWVFKIGNSTIAYGKFIQSVIDFIIIAFVVFVVIHAISKFEKKKEEEKKEEKVPEDVLLLREIRDLLQK
jgi:large conductance mechanosensitive channel